MKHVVVEADEERLVHLSAKPNLKRLGPKYGKQLGILSKTIAALKGADLGKLRIDGKLTLEPVPGQVFELTAEDILVQRQEKAGMTVANEGAIIVALDTRLTPELELEGWAREAVSKLQNLRKEQNLEVVDRIRIQYVADGPVAQALATQKDYICNETLALELTPVAQADDSFAEVEMAGQKASFKITKA